MPLHYTLEYVTLHCTTLHYITLQCIDLYHITQDHITLLYLAWLYVTLYYFTLHTTHWHTTHHVALHSVCTNMIIRIYIYNTLYVIWCTNVCIYIYTHINTQLNTWQNQPKTWMVKVKRNHYQTVLSKTCDAPNVVILGKIERRGCK